MADETQQTQTSTDNTDQGGGDAKWYDFLPDDLKGNETLTAIDGVESLAKAHLASLEQIKTLTPEVPDKPEGYGLPTKFEGMPDSMVTEAAASIAKNALDAGLTKDQAGKLMAGLMAEEKASLEAEAKAIQAARDETVKGLKKDFGEKWEERLSNGITRINQIAEKSGMKPDDFKAMLNESGIGDNPTFIRWAISLAELISPDVFEQSNASKAAKTAAQVLFPTMTAQT